MLEPARCSIAPRCDRERAARTESRGAPAADHAELDDAKFLRHSLAPTGGEPPEIRYPMPSSIVATRRARLLGTTSEHAPAELAVLRYTRSTASRASSYWSSAGRVVVLDALNHVKETVDPDAFLPLVATWRSAACGMMIDGEAVRKTFLRDYPGVIRVESLAHFPIERDLATVTDFIQARAREAVPDPKERRRRRTPSTGRRPRS